ncbi:hypothetical protein XELAEV_18032065mg [Xenopus laevis]|uniref:Uncharacterized protein n=1 Tax=Xenopus laevis TaxID=8355 RepID=A0A974HGP3_XENLA|nr:hypothetical protein XELAEV_18032065mg [Xenopus laevis]
MHTISKNTVNAFYFCFGEIVRHFNTKFTFFPLIMVSSYALMLSHQTHLRTLTLSSTFCPDAFTSICCLFLFCNHLNLNQLNLWRLIECKDTLF